MKKIAMILLIMVMSISSIGCTQKGANNNKKNSNSEKTNISEKEAALLDGIKVNTYGELETLISEDVEETITNLKSEWDKLSNGITTYDQYVENKEEVEQFYDKITNNITHLCIRLRVYSLKYAQLIMASDQSTNDKYDDFENIYDEIYDDAADEIYDEIYDDLFDKMYDYFYDGMLDDAYDVVSYSEWSKTHSNEYKWWSRTHSDVYDEWSDLHSDIYDFYSDMRSNLYSHEIEDANEEMHDFQEDITKLINKNS